MYLCKFGQNLSIGSKDNARKRSNADADADADGIRTKNNMSPPFGWGDIIPLCIDDILIKYVKLSVLAPDERNEFNFSEVHEGMNRSGSLAKFT